jgi:CRISPR/Cas system-associated exonuclease Cas4 (RecB family)
MMKVSPSLIKNFMRCPLQAKFNYIDKIPQQQSSAASFGSAVHLALELYNNTNDLDAAERCFLFAWDYPKEFGLEPEIWNRNTSYGQYRERGIEFIRNYHEENKWVEREILATEHRFCVPFRNHMISGIVDILETPNDSNILKITDLKTGYRPSAHNLSFDVQFTSYMWAATQREFWVGYEPEIEKYCGFPNGEELFDRFKNHDIVGVWYDLRKCKEYEVGPRTEADFNRLHRCLDEIEKAVNLEVFVPNISGESCGLCSYQDICPLYSGEPVGEEND